MDFFFNPWLLKYKIIKGKINECLKSIDLGKNLETLYQKKRKKDFWQLFTFHMEVV